MCNKIFFKVIICGIDLIPALPPFVKSFYVQVGCGAQGFILAQSYI